MSRRNLLDLAAYFVLLVALAGSILLRQAPTDGASNIRTRTFALNVVNSSIPAWTSADDLLRKMSSSIPGLHTEFGGPTDGDAGKQIAELDALLERRISGIILCPADPLSLAPTVKEAAARGIPVVTIFGDVPGSPRLTTITAAEQISAYNLGEKVIAEKDWAHAPEGSIQVIVIITKPGLTFAEQRLAGLRKAFSEYKAIKLVQVVSNEWSDKIGAEKVAAALQSYPQLAAVFGTDSRAAIGAVSALKEAGKTKGSVTVTGWDADGDTLQSVSDGWVNVTSAPNITFMTQVAVSILDSYNLGYLYPASLKIKEFDLPALPDHVDILQTMIDSSNVQAYFPGKRK